MNRILPDGVSRGNRHAGCDLAPEDFDHAVARADGATAALARNVADACGQESGGGEDYGSDQESAGGLSFAHESEYSTYLRITISRRATRPRAAHLALLSIPSLEVGASLLYHCVITSSPAALGEP